MLQHIKDHHPKDYERFAGYMTEIIVHPDYILAANLPNTAFVLKRIEDNGELFELILRLKIKNDPVDYKNSVVTFLRINSMRNGVSHYALTRNLSSHCAFSLCSLRFHSKAEEMG